MYSVCVSVDADIYNPKGYELPNVIPSSVIALLGITKSLSPVPAAFASVTKWRFNIDVVGPLSVGVQVVVTPLPPSFFSERHVANSSTNLVVNNHKSISCVPPAVLFNIIFIVSISELSGIPNEVVVGKSNINNDIASPSAPELAGPLTCKTSPSLEV